MENKVCNNCGAILHDSGLFCSKCGAKITVDGDDETSFALKSNDSLNVKRNGNVCSLLAVIFGAIGFIPLLNFLFLPAAIILAVIGLAICKNRKKGITIASIIVVVISLVVSVMWFFLGSDLNKRTSEPNETVAPILQEEEEYEYISFPETVKTECYEIYIEGVYFNSEIRPKRTDGWYSYKSAETGKQYCYIKGTVKNIDGVSHQISITGDFVFDSTYNYSGIMLKDVKNGVDNVSLYETIQPLETIDFYYACSVPDEMVNNYNSAELKLDISTDLWDDNYDTLSDKYSLSFSK